MFVRGIRADWDVVGNHIVVHVRANLTINTPVKHRPSMWDKVTRQPEVWFKSHQIDRHVQVALPVEDFVDLGVEPAIEFFTDSTMDYLDLDEEVRTTIRGMVRMKIHDALDAGGLLESIEESVEGARLAKQSKELPGIHTYVEYPCKHGEKPWSYPNSTIRYIIMHLNDDCKWSRESIADWLDELHDSGAADLTFKVEIDEDSRTG